MEVIKKFDKLSIAHVQHRVSGGILTILAYACVVAYLLVYVINARQDEYPTSVSVDPFPTETDPMIMPPMNCVATDGCYISAPVGVDKLRCSNALLVLSVMYVHYRCFLIVLIWSKDRPWQRRCERYSTLQIHRTYLQYCL